MVPYMFAVNEYFVLEKIITLLFERNKLIINILLKDVSRMQSLFYIAYIFV